LFDSGQGTDTGVYKINATVAELGETHQRNYWVSGDADHASVTIWAYLHPDEACRQVGDGVLVGVQIVEKLSGALFADATPGDE